MLLFWDSAAHFFVDAVCAATVFSGTMPAEHLPLYILIYNTLAFSTQCVVGLVTDGLKHHRGLTALSCLCVAAGLILPLPGLLKIIIVGLGNSVFHVGGGTITLKHAGEKAAPLGVFVAPGCMGLVLGTLYPQFGFGFALGLCVCVIGIWFAGKGEIVLSPARREKPCMGMLVPVILLLAVAVRAIGGTVMVFPWKNTDVLSILMVFCVFLGKTFGGLALDRAGAWKITVFSVPLAAVLIVLFSDFAAPSMLGQFALNLTMPVTLYLIYRAMPDSPGFAFGLAASALWPGTIGGQLLRLTGPALRICLVLCFAVQLAAVLWSVKKLEKHSGTTIV